MADKCGFFCHAVGVWALCVCNRKCSNITHFSVTLKPIVSINFCMNKKCFASATYVTTNCTLKNDQIPQLLLKWNGLIKIRLKLVWKKSWKKNFG